MSQDSILVVEESSVLSDLVRDLLEAAGFDVIQAPSPKDAVALIKETRYAAVIVDADTPRADAPQTVVDEIDSDPDSASTPVVLLSSAEPGQLVFPPGVPSQNLVHKPIDPVELIVLVRRVVGQETSAPPPAQTATADSVQPVVKVSGSKTRGKIITVFSLKGGVGTSTIAVNLAIALQRLWGEATVLVDLSLESGALNILLDIMPNHTVDELVAANGTMTTESVTHYLVPHKSGVSLLSAPPSPERAELVDGASLRKAMSFLRDQFDYVVVDTASTFAEHTIMALEMADQIILPLIGDISAVRATTMALDIFQALSIPDDRVILAFNELFPKAGLSRKHAENSMRLPTRFIPFGGAKLLDSVNLGAPIVMTDPDGPVSQAIEDLAFEVSHEDSVVRASSRPSDLLTRVKKRLKS